MATSIPISGLNTLSVVTSSDFIPIVQSSSMTTYRVPIEVFGDWISSDVVITSSLTSISSSYADSSSVSVSSSYSLVTDNLNYPNTSTASYAISSSYSHITTSASYSLFATSASYSLKSTSSSFATSASWSSVQISGSWASRSFNSTSSSFADRSISASYALSASYSFTSSNANTASYISVGSTGPKFFDNGIPVDDAFVSRTTPIGFNAVTSGVPAGSTTVILQANVTSDFMYYGYIRIRKNSSCGWFLLLNWTSTPSGIVGNHSGQGIFPLDSDGTFEYQVIQVLPVHIQGHWYINMLGYY